MSRCSARSSSEWVICAPASQPRMADPGIWNIGRGQRPFQYPPSPVILSPGACQNQLEGFKILKSEPLEVSKILVSLMSGTSADCSSVCSFFCLLKKQVFPESQPSSWQPLQVSFTPSAPPGSSRMSAAVTQCVCLVTQWAWRPRLPSPPCPPHPPVGWIVALGGSTVGLMSFS